LLFRVQLQKNVFLIIVFCWFFCYKNSAQFIDVKWKVWKDQFLMSKLWPNPKRNTLMCKGCESADTSDDFIFHRNILSLSLSSLSLSLRHTHKLLHTHSHIHTLLSLFSLSLKLSLSSTHSLTHSPTLSLFFSYSHTQHTHSLSLSYTRTHTHSWSCSRMYVVSSEIWNAASEQVISHKRISFPHKNYSGQVPRDWLARRTNRKGHYKVGQSRWAHAGRYLSEEIESWNYKCNTSRTKRLCFG